MVIIAAIPGNIRWPIQSCARVARGCWK